MGNLGLNAKLVAAGLAGIVVSQVTPALAAIDLGPLAVTSIDMVQVILLAIAGWLSTYGVKFLASRVLLQDTQLETLLASRLNEALAHGIALAAAAARKKATESGKLVIEIDNPFVEIAAKYVISAMPDTLKRFGWTMERLQRAIVSRAQQMLPADVGDGRAVPVTALVADLVHAEGAVAAVATPFTGSPL